MNESTGLAPESAPSLADLATPEEGAGAWPDGWYRGEIIAGYATGTGKAFETTDQMAKDPVSRNLFICLRLDGGVYVPSSRKQSDRKLMQGPGGTRNIRATFNYRITDLSAERIAQIKDARERFKDVQGAWPDKSLQASSLSIGRLGQLEKAVGFKLPIIGGRTNPAPFVSQKLDVRLSFNSETEFSDVAAVAASGTHVK
jgi:hypothetical protein